jgi:hypothetical protein
MQSTRRIPLRTKRPARAPRRPARRAARPSTSSTAAQRRVGPPEDYATYSCSCGYVFEAPVTTTVGCPHCRTQLAW